MRRSFRLFTFLLLLAGLAPAHAGHSPPKVLLRVYVQTTEGLPETEARPISIPPDNEVIQVRPLPELTEGDLVAVQADAAGAVHLHFNHLGQINLNACTAENQGKILVVMVDGFIVYAPTIDEQLSEGELVLPHPLAPEIVQLLQETAAQNVKKAAKT